MPTLVTFWLKFGRYLWNSTQDLWILESRGIRLSRTGPHSYDFDGTITDSIMLIGTQLS